MEKTLVKLMKESLYMSISLYDYVFGGLPKRFFYDRVFKQKQIF